MALTNGQAHTLHMLLNTRSQFRMHIEGKYTVTAGPGGVATYNYSENLPPNYAAPDAPTLVGNVISQASLLNIPGGNFDPNTKAKLALLFDPNGADLNGAITNVSTNPVTLRHALALDGPYPDNSPCPPFSVEQRAATAMAAALPGPIGS
jgi:hypothetical protein